MKFTPDYGVFYRDGFHPAGRPFEILPEDAAEMRRHGKVEEEPVQESILFPDPPKPKTTRRKKAE